jgi:hypothetical protein
MSDENWVINTLLAETDKRWNRIEKDLDRLHEDVEHLRAELASIRKWATTLSVLVALLLFANPDLRSLVLGLVGR